LAVKRGLFVSGRIPYAVLRGSWYNIIVLNEPVKIEEKSVEKS
jgi:hypothetical protein